MNKKNFSGNRHQVLSWVVGASLLAPTVLAVHAQAQQDQTQQGQAQSGQNGNWGQAGPPPDAQNGQIPPPPADAQQPSDNPVVQNGTQSSPEEQNPQYPAQPPQAGGQPGRAPYQGSPQGYPPNQGYPSQGYPSQGYPNQGYQPQAQTPQSYAPVQVGAGTLLKVRLSEALDTKKLQPDDYFQGTVAQSVFSGSVIAIPRGAEVVGRVVDVKKAGDLKGSAGFMLQLTSLNMGGQSYTLVSDVWSFDGPGKGGYTAGNTIGGAALGAAIGAIAGGGTGAAIGAAAGTGAGLGASAITPGPRGVIPPESVISFHLTQPVTVRPVSYQEAQELEQNSAPPQPRLYTRAPYPPVYGPGPYYYPAPYAYAYPYPYVYAYPYPYVRYYRYRYWR
jgi:hypothetical protein